MGNIVFNKNPIFYISLYICILLNYNIGTYFEIINFPFIFMVRINIHIYFKNTNI